MTSFQLETSIDDVTFERLGDSVGDVITFAANSDRDTMVNASVPVDTCAKFLRLFPVDYRAWKSMRWEVFGCTVGDVTF